MPRQTNQLGRLQESLVLFKYMLHLFGCNDLKALSADLKDPALEGTNDEGESLLYHALVQHLYDFTSQRNSYTNTTKTLFDIQKKSM